MSLQFDNFVVLVRTVVLNCHSVAFGHGSISMAFMEITFHVNEETLWEGQSISIFVDVDYNVVNYCAKGISYSFCEIRYSS
jgi:hypothetical protein